MKKIFLGLIIISESLIFAVGLGKIWTFFIPNHYDGWNPPGSAILSFFAFFFFAIFYLLLVSLAKQKSATWKRWVIIGPSIVSLAAGVTLFVQ